MSVRRCRCGRYIEWLSTSRGRLPFDHELVPVDQLDDRQGWLVSRVVVRGVPRALVVPMEHCNPEKRAAARRVLVVHHCTQHEAPAVSP
jgi:hypothetical protein